MTQVQPTARPGSGAPDRATAWLSVGTILAAQFGFMLVGALIGPNTSTGNGVAVAGTAAVVVLALFFQRKLGLPVGEFGLKRPSNWGRTILLGLLVAIVSGALTQFTLAGLQPLLGGEGADISRFDSVRGNLRVLLTTVPVVWVTSAFPEELVWRGFLLTRMAGLGGNARPAWGLALVVTSVVFGALHFYQGATGMISTGLVGFFFGLGFLLTGRNLWVPIIAHATIHLISFTALYLGRV